MELSDVTVFLNRNVGNLSTVTGDFLLSFLCSFLDNRLNLINRIVAVFPEELEISLRTSQAQTIKLAQGMNMSLFIKL